MPILKVRRQINKLRKGDQLEILADDETFLLDFPIFCVHADLKLLNNYQANNVSHLTVEITR